MLRACRPLVGLFVLVGVVVGVPGTASGATGPPGVFRFHHAFASFVTDAGPLSLEGLTEVDVTQLRFTIGNQTIESVEEVWVADEVGGGGIFGHGPAQIHFDALHRATATADLPMVRCEASGECVALGTFAFSVVFTGTGKATTSSGFAPSIAKSRPATATATLEGEDLGASTFALMDYRASVTGL
jgi:hypothetical protein